MTFVVPKLLAVVVMAGIGNISFNLRYHVPDFKYRRGFKVIESKDVGVGVNKLVIFSYGNLFLPLILVVFSGCV